MLSTYLLWLFWNYESHDTCIQIMIVFYQGSQMLKVYIVSEAESCDFQFLKVPMSKSLYFKDWVRIWHLEFILPTQHLYTHELTEPHPLDCVLVTAPYQPAPIGNFSTQGSQH